MQTGCGGILSIKICTEKVYKSGFGVNEENSVLFSSASETELISKIFRNKPYSIMRL